MKSPRLDANTVVDAHQVGIWRYLRFLGCEPSEADDICQETFLSVLEAPFEDHDNAATASYLRTVARNLLLKAKRHSARKPRVEDLERAEDVWARVAAADSGDGYVDALRRCLAQMKGRARLALDLRYRESRSRAQIAAQLQIHEDGVKSLLQRARSSLRDCIERRLGT